MPHAKLILLTCDSVMLEERKPSRLSREAALSASWPALACSALRSAVSFSSASTVFSVKVPSRPCSVSTSTLEGRKADEGPIVKDVRTG